jgi:hypothetical protein
MKDDDEIERRWLPILLNGLEPYLIKKKELYKRRICAETYCVMIEWWPLVRY